MQNWIGPVLGAIVGAILAQIFYAVRKRKGDKVVITRKSETNQLKVSDLSLKDLVVTYEGMPVNQIVVNTFEVVNTGDNDLKDVMFSLCFDTLQKHEDFFVVPEIKDPLNVTEIISNPNKTPTQIDFKRPFLNRIKAHETEKIQISLISDQKIQFEINGGGKGWSIEYRDIAARNEFVYNTFLDILFKAIVDMVR